MLKIYHMFYKSSFFVNIVVINFCQVSRVQISLMFRTSGFKTAAGFSNVQGVRKVTIQSYKLVYVRLYSNFTDTLYIPEQFLQGIW